MHRLGTDFYLRNTIEIARACLGKILVYESDEGVVSGRIVETEAYTQNDPACHAGKGMTKRNSVMFGDPGRAYVYFTYGFHHCLNLVTQPSGTAEAVLIRALKPLDGIDIMTRNRGKQSLRDLCSGPGKLTQAFGINVRLNGEDLSRGTLGVYDDGFEADTIIERPRIGIREGADLLWRFYPAECAEWVSKK